MSERTSASSLDRSTFERWVHEHHAAVYRTALAVLRDSNDAQDVAQEVFLRVLEGAAEGEPVREPERLLRWLAARGALAHMRGAAGRRRREDRHAMQHPSVTPAPVPEETEARGAVERLVALLPTELRLPLVLRFHEGLTFRELGEVLECSEPTAHSRVNRALERLRGELSRTGFAGAVLSLPELIGPGTGPPIPTALEPRLLALGAREAAGLAALSSSWLSAALVIVALAAGALVWVALRDPGADELASAVRAEVPGGAVAVPAVDTTSPAPSREALGSEHRVDPPLARPTPPAPVAAPRAAPALSLGAPDEHPLGVIEGRAVDANGSPVAGATVVARSAEQTSKVPRFVVEGAADALGDFRLEVPVTRAEGQHYRLRAARGERRSAVTDLVRVDAGAVAPHQRLVLSRSAAPEGEFRLTLTVADEDGRPVAGAAAILYRAVLDGSGRSSTAVEAHGKTDPGGRLELAGSHLGPKLLSVVAPEHGLRPHRELVEMSAPGDRAHPVTLAAGLSITGFVRAVDGELDATPTLHAAPQESEAIGTAGVWSGVRPVRPQARVRPDGSFAIHGLAPGPHRVSASAWGWSTAEVGPVTAGTRDLAIRLKRTDDVRDVGDHLAEIHGVVRDAATGEPLACADYAVRVKRLPDVDAATLLTDHAFDLVRPFLGQVMEDRSPAPDFHQTGLAPGRYAVVVNRRSYAPALVGPIELAAGALRTGVVVELRRPAVLTGTVTDAAGRPVEGAIVFLTGAGASAAADVRARDERCVANAGRGLMHIGHLARTDAAGSFRLGGVATEIPARLAAVHSGHEPAAPRAFEAQPGAEASGLVLRLGPSR